MQVVVIGSNSVESYFSPKFKSPGLVKSIQALTDTVQGLKTAVESMDKRLETLETILRPHTCPSYVVHVRCLSVQLNSGNTEAIIIPMHTVFFFTTDCKCSSTTTYYPPRLRMRRWTIQPPPSPTFQPLTTFLF